MVNLYNQIQQISGDGQEDDEEEQSGGGGGAFDQLAGAADHLAGSTDEAVARTFDQEAGGGVLAGTGDFLGVDEFRESETGRRFQTEAAEAGGGLGGAAARFDIVTRAGLDFLLDNPGVSVQDTVRGGLEAATGEEDVGEAAQDVATQVQEAGQETVEGTPFDNPVTSGAVTVFDALVADPAKAGLRGLTGIDVDTGSEEGTVGAIDAFDIGVTAATFGTGKAGVGAARAAAHSDEAAGLASRFSDIFAGSDEGAALLDDTGAVTGQAGRAADEAAQAAEEGGLAIDFDALEEAANATVSGADEAAQAAVGADEAGEFGTDIFGRLTGGGRESPSLADGLLGTGDDLASRISRFTDDITSRFARGTDEPAQLTDEGAQTAEEGGGALSRLLGTRRRQAAVAGAGILGGGAVATALRQEDELAVEDPQTGESFTLIKEEDLRPTEDHPEGATLWRVDTESGSQGYTVILEIKGRNVYIMGADGGPRRAQVDVETLRNAVQNLREGGR